MLLEIIGWVGAILFALCGVPQARKCWKQGHTNGLDDSFLAMWFFGEILTLIYVIPTGQLPLVFNYLFNLVCLLIILKFRFWPKLRNS